MNVYIYIFISVIRRPRQETVPSFPDAYIPRTPKAVVAVEVPQVLPTDPSVAPTAPVTPISRKPTPQKPTPQETKARATYATCGVIFL